MHAPADKIAKRISAEEWLARYDALDLLAPRNASRERALNYAPPPADRIAVRT